MSGARARVDSPFREGRDARIEALADHFDVTDASTLPWEEADDVEIARPQLAQISLRLPREDIVELKRRASRAGVGYTTLIRMILREHVRDPIGRQGVDHTTAEPHSAS